jgi:hypothetical protein
VIGNHESIDIFIGLDLGKGEHHAVALDRAGRKRFDKELLHDQAWLREILGSLNKHCSILLVVDQPATKVRSPLPWPGPPAFTVGYLPGLAMRRIADLHWARRRLMPKRPGLCPTLPAPSRPPMVSPPS